MKNLLNLRWLHGSPNQTGETLTRENRLGIVTCLNPMRTLLITLLLLTLGVGQMWGYTILRCGELSGGSEWSNSDAMTRIGSTNVYYKTYNSPTATTDLFFRIGTGNDWETKKDNTGIDNLNSNIVMIATSEHDNCVRFQVPVSVPVTIYYNDNTDKIWIKVDSYKTDVLNGKEMFYYGFTNSWSETFAHFYDNGTRKFGNYAANSYADHSAKLAIGVYDVNGSTNYSASNSGSWAGVTHTGMAAGCQIQTYNDNGNKCYYNEASTFSFGTTDFTIVTGQTIASFPTISFTSKTSGVGSSLSLEGYYYSTATSGETWTAFTPGTTESSLAAGTYYIKAIATDGAIYMASTNYITLTVNSAPVLGVANATSVTRNSATFNATATLNSNTTSSYGFKYGAGASYDTKAELISGGTSASTTGALDGTTFSKEVTGLSASTTYYYISYAVVNGTTYYSSEVKSFTTSAAATYNLSVVAGTGISAVTGTTNNISASQNIDISATVATGYTWSTWTKTGTGTLSMFTAKTQNQTVTVGTVGDMTLTASATEKKSTITVTTATSSQGTLMFGSTSKSWGATASVGVATEQSITATAAAGFTFVRWDLSGAAASESSLTSATITLKADGSGNTGTATAVFAEDLSSTWIVAGGNKIVTTGDTWRTSLDENNVMKKKTGHSTESVVYYTVDIDAANQGESNSNYQFKIRNTSGDGTWYGLTATGQYYLQRDNDSDVERALNTSGANIELRADGAGEYIIKVDYTDEENPTITVTFPVDGEYSYTLSANGHGSVSASDTKLHSTPAITITATPEPGYRFVNWTSTGGGTVEFGNANNATTTVTATEDGAVITANFTNDGFIYFDRTAVNGVWAGSDVYVTFFSNNEHWKNEDPNKGAAIAQNYVNAAVFMKKMHRIPNTNIYYFDYKTEGGNNAPTAYYAFTDKSVTSSYVFFNMAAVVRGDMNISKCNMFVVENHVEKSVNSVGYYYGYWMKYNETGSGIRLHVYNTDGSVEVSGSPKEFTTANAGDRQFTASINLSASTNYKFKVEGFNGIWYGNSGTMTSSNSTAWDFVERVGSNCNFNTTGSGSYKFTLVCTDAGKLKVSLEFPLDVNDYRLVYNGKIDTEGSAHAHPSDFIRNVANGGSGKDTVSFFVTDDGSGDDFSLTLQKCTAVSPRVTWGNACDAGHTLTASQLGLTGKTGVYYFVLEQNQGDGCSGVKITDIQPYTGNYYIRTDAAGGGWEAYETTPDNKMEYSSYSKEHSGYDYYYCHWVPTGKNIHFTIANDYSPCITDTLKQGTAPFNFENLPYEASVRFMYNSETNVIGRVYLNGSNEGTTEYLSLRAMNDSIRIDASTPIYKSGSENHLKLQDMGNWIYQKDIQVQEGTHYRLISNYRFNGADNLQYFKGKDGTWNESTTELLLGGKSASYQTLRLVYDFKTNHLMAAWLVPESGNSPALVLKTNVMILQQNQDTARQITFAETSHALTEIDTVYSTINLTKNFMQNIGQSNSEAARQFFYVSFPYDVDLSDVFGSVGEYGVDWAIQWYDGKKRAREGFWADSEPNWKFFETAKGSTLRAYEGYVLTLNLSKFLDDSKWKYDVTDIYLYFPSKDKIGTIHNESSKIVRIMPEDENATDYTCTINRATPDGDRTIKDSHWHCIGSPSFARNSSNTWNTHDGTSEDWKAENLPFLYEWNSATNTLAPVASGGAYKFKPLTAYLVQYEGPTITWTDVVTVANPIVARRAPETPDNETTFKLSLMRGEEKIDQTFVRISDNEAVTSGFEFGQDLCKEFQRGANIYTIVENTEVAGNSLPLETEKTTTVPVGIRIATAGEYTFAMPEGTNGTGVVLVDTENGTRTNLALGDYTVTLGAGTTDGRFVLEISPVANTPTGMDNVQGDNVQCTKAQKRMIDGVLYIVKDGKAYDARGTREE